LTVPAPRKPAPPSSWALGQIVAAASIGNALEWFDILVYGYFAVVISRQFFPATDETTALLLAFATFGTSYLIRPIGAIVLGAYGDKAGRKAGMTVSILLMMAGTLLMAIMPGYSVIGIAAPLGVLAARLLQGFAIGGEFGSATAFMVEHSGARRGFLASFQWVGQGFAAVAASFFGIVLANVLTPAQLNDWGWRIPFFFGLLIGPIGFYIRNHVDETPEFLATAVSKTPVRDVVVRQWDRLLLATGAVIMGTSSNYLILYMPTYAIKELNLPQSSGFTATLLGGLILTFGSPLMGHWSDKIGRTRILIAASVLFLATAYPVFVLLASYANLGVLIAVVCWLSLMKTAYSGVLPSFMAEIFPTNTRCTGMSLAYNIAVPMFGGFAPLIVAALIQATGSNLAPSLYLMVTALLSITVLIVARRHLGLR